MPLIRSNLYSASDLYPSVPLMTPGYMISEYWIAYYNNDRYWIHYGEIKFFRGAPFIEDTLNDDPAISRISNSSIDIKSRSGEPTVSRTLNNTGSIL